MGAQAQSSVSLAEPASPLLPPSFGAWKTSSTTASASGGGSLSLVNISKSALEECGPQRSQVSDYSNGGRTIHVEAIQFNDRSGAFSAYTLVRRPDMRQGHDLGSSDSVGDGAVLFTAGSSMVLVTPATAADLASLKPLAEVLPKVTGNKGIAPLLPSFVPVRGLDPASVRYAMGPATYTAQGGVLPANSLGWDKSGEAVTAAYADKRGKETLTLLLYPTPEIAGAFARAVHNSISGMGPGFASARLRREGELVILASGTFSPEDAQRTVENVHMSQQVSFDKDVQPVFHTEVQKTYSLLANIAILSAVLMLSAVLLGLFLGGGRAMIRVLQGKPAAVEPEFLSLHLAPQNKPPAPVEGNTSQ